MSAEVLTPLSLFFYPDSIVTSKAPPLCERPNKWGILDLRYCRREKETHKDSRLRRPLIPNQVNLLVPCLLEDGGGGMFMVSLKVEM